ncbi:uncharacterized protein C9E9.15 isoform X1 [Diachasma alloeum]|uniref:uncharacterized protein C9E9.15 isoform X1 n=1 Tax=Diachasma alloeum TaxID=454923 RepID=UPI0007381F75|nr:uncharacterized protein C9E9.15 isoform X1 [Diachasma alloeum]XP_015112416.1 uncharacterized protein C9E9.15 isoform X1 [Diachasma alloeum]
MVALLLHQSKMRISKILATSMMMTVLAQSTSAQNITLFDFTRADNVDQWSEISDTVRTVGMSKAALTLQKTQVFQRAVFFTLLNPQPNGAGFAGVRVPTVWNLTEYRNIEIKCRGQGANDHYKVVLRHKGLSANNEISYEQFFTVPLSTEEFSTITLPLVEFKPYFRGRQKPDGEPLDTARITMFGLQVYGGVYSAFKQKGVSALEVETIVATT